MRDLLRVLHWVYGAHPLEHRRYHGDAWYSDGCSTILSALLMCVCPSESVATSDVMALLSRLEFPNRPDAKADVLESVAYTLTTQSVRITRVLVDRVHFDFGGGG